MRNLFYSHFLFFSFWFSPLFFSSCSSLDHGSLIEQELRFRPGYSGLTHSNGDGIGQKILIYDFHKEEDIKRLRDVRLICKVGERRFYVCSDKAALCSNLDEIKTFLGIPYTTKLVTEILYVPEDIQTLIDANTYCAAQGSVSEKDMF